MLSKNVIKDIQSLGHKQWRDSQGLFVAEGPKIVEEFIQIIPEQIVHIYGTEEWINEHKELKNTTTITDDQLSKISSLKTPNAVLAVVKQFSHEQPHNASFSLYLDTIQDPGNFGTIIRIADWFGVEQIVCTAGCADLYNPKVVQSTMASIARVKVFYDLNAQWLQQQSHPNIYAATLGGTPLTDVAKTEKGILVIGNESKGISAEVLRICNNRITITKRGQAESLNAAVATGIILSHLIVT